jgi:hypothetical protein
MFVNIFNLNREFRNNLRTVKFYEEEDNNNKIEKETLHLRDKNKRVSLLMRKRKEFKNDYKYEENSLYINHVHPVEDLFKQLTLHCPKQHLIDIVKNVRSITSSEKSLIYLYIKLK